MLQPQRQPGLISLRALVPSASFVGCADIIAPAVTEHSQDCTPGCLFAALPGTRTHGREFVKHALQRGAAAILTDRPLADVSLPQCIVPDARQVYGRLCQGLYAFPSHSLGVAGVTGTNGKTTTTWIVRSLLESAAHPTGLIGTIEYNDGMVSERSRLTTPDALTLARSLAAMRERRTSHVAIELSSHALKQGRAAGMLLDVGVITNITQDHFDYHGTFHDYIRAKAKISGMIKRGGVLLLNADDPNMHNVLERLEADVQVCTFGIDNPADLQADNVKLTPQGTQFRLHYRDQRLDCFTPLVGRHNVGNCLAAAGTALHFGMSLNEIASGFEQCSVVPGRLQRINSGRGFYLFVDYAHTDDALRRVIQSVKSISSGRVIVCFGAGGDRDRNKRPLMGRAAALADEIVLTSDNPRSEDPYHIIDQIQAGVPVQWGTPRVQIDRREAIQLALSLAGPGDAVIIAGKGHEREQIVGDQVFAFDDVAECRNALRQMGTQEFQPYKAA